MTEPHHSTRPGTVTPLGDGALRLETEDTESATAAALALREAACPGVRDVVAGLHSVVVIFDPLLADSPDLAARLHEVDRTPIRQGPGRRISVPVRFDGSDLAEVGEMSGLGVRGTIDALTAEEFTVALLGFSPGFAYLTGLPDPLARIPRRSFPRPSVAAGSVALAGGYAAVYPQSTPGGWQVVGRTALSLFDPETPPYAVVSSGDRVSFVEVDAVIGPRPADSGRGDGIVRPASPVGSVPTFFVEHPGTFSLIQDVGRVGLAHLGVPAAGAADPVSARLANALVGNPPGTPILEIAGRGPVLTCRRSCFIAAVGGEPRLWLDGSEVLAARVVPIATGQRLSISGPERGMRTYLGVAGGFSVAPVMMSTSTDMLSGLGPGPLAASDELAVGAPVSMLADHLVADAAAAHPGRRVLRVLPGPEADWLQGASLHSLAARRFVVESASDRVGVRLRVDDDHGPVGRLEGEVSSSGMVTGAVQLPPSGQPIVLLPDHATLGGYPVVAVVITADLGELGQCSPGEEVLFAPISSEEAAQARASLERSLQRAVAGHYPLVSG